MERVFVTVETLSICTTNRVFILEPHGFVFGSVCNSNGRIV